MTSRIDAQCALVDTRSGMVRGLARAVALALQFDQQAAVMTCGREQEVPGRMHHEDRACQPPRVHEIVDSGCRGHCSLACDHRPRRGRDLEAEMLLLAAER